MKTIYKYIEFKKIDAWWFCCNRKSGATLGSVNWSSGWKMYVIEPEAGTEFSPDCLRDIAEFMENLNKERKS